MDTVLVKFAGIAQEFTVSKVLDLGFTEVRWYGAIIAFGFLLAVLFGGRIAYVWEINLDKMIDVLLFGTMGAIVGARLYYVAFKWDYYSQHLSEIPKIWEGGLAIYGGIIGGLLLAFIVCKVEKINVPNLLDLVGMSLLIGQGIGRWGNYANQEAFGTFTYKNWGMMSDTVIDYIEANPASFGLEGVSDIASYIAENNLYVHPTFFYESVWCLLGFLILYIILKKFRKFSGQLFLTYGVWYGLERMIVEGMRTDSLYIGDTNIRVSQALSFGIVLVCGVLLTALLIKYTKNPKPIEGVDFYGPMTEKEWALHERKLARRKRAKDWRAKTKERITARFKKSKVSENV
ncbi:MAG: prolipoprotein diacylglyceryl transferase [Clostridia bacterium]|nr:prolipoprotein diacylglyceryl transferase [Clostridia bacterium]